MKKSYLARAASFTTMSLATLLLSGCGVEAGKGGFTINTPTAGPTSTAAAGFRAQKSLELKDFHAIDSSAVATLVITDGQPFAVIVEAEESVVPKVVTTVKDGVLNISLEKDVSTSNPVRILISLPKLDKLTLAGVGEVTVSGVKEPFLTIKQSGAGSCNISGSADMVDLTLSGVGSAQLKELKARALTALLSGTGSAHVFASESLTATISGIGSLKYSGNPPKLQKNVTGIGQINAAP
ncbi:MAG: DUF2807 domain-containing protein [Cyanobacteria bacterium REEB67]|nr:DUF2807 domain-containing protein [Cyanobacteria bacterium REEB67]